MQIEGIGAAGLDMLSTVATTDRQDDTGSFAGILSDAIAAVSETDAADQADVAALLTGQSGDLHNTVIASQKADIALRMTIQIRNKVIDAYSEIMRMQV